MKKFWMVYVVGRSSPTYQHPTLDAAKQEAGRLCKELKVRAYVLEAIEACDLVDVVWSRILE